jgi:hypothetical protein
MPSPVEGQDRRLDRGLAVRRRLSVCPVAGGDAKARDPMHVEAALRAVRHPGLELALEVGLQELEPEHLRVDRDQVIASTSSLCLVNELVGLGSLLGDGADGVLEDLAFTAGHEGRLAGRGPSMVRERVRSDRR